MELKNSLRAGLRAGSIGPEVWQETVRTKLLLMAPFTPHIAEEMWSRIGGDYSIHSQAWPEWDEEKARADTVALVVMVNGRPRGEAQVAVDITREAGHHHRHRERGRAPYPAGQGAAEGHLHPRPHRAGAEGESGCALKECPCVTRPS